MGARSKEDSKSPKESPGCLYGFDFTLKAEAFRFCQKEFSAETLGLPPHGIGKGHAACPFYAGVVNHFGGDRNLPAKVIFFYHQHPVAGAGKVQGGGQARGAAAYHNNIVKIFVLLSHKALLRRRPDLDLCGKPYLPHRSGLQ
jgi:hypothetical protein